MRSLLLTSSAIFFLSAGAALASPPPSTPTNITIPFQNANSGFDSSAATNGGTSTNDSLNSAKDSWAGLDSASATSGGTSVNNSNDPSKNSWASGGSSSATSGSVATTVDDNTLKFTTTNVHENIHLATSTNEGTVGGLLVVSGGSGGYGHSSHGSTGPLTGDNVARGSLDGSNGILSLQQNTGIDSLQQNSVALSSVVSGSGSAFSGSGF